MKRAFLLFGLWVCPGLFGADNPSPPPADFVKFAGLEPLPAAQAITLPPGFSAKLFAGEPDVIQPIAFALDARGRVWVAEGMTYPKRAPEGQGKDRILILEDTDGDHRFDRRTVFMENLNLVSGLEVGFGGVWIGAAPYLMFVPDRNRDDKPDGPAEILLDGWDYLRDTHETLNTFTWGPDGWLYGCHGVFCPSFVGKPGTPDPERQRVDAAVWRYHPTKHRFEVFAEGTSNPWGVDFDEHGQCFIEACVIPHLWHMIQGGRYERQGGQHYNVGRDEQDRNARYQTATNQRHVNPFVFDDIKTIGDHVHWLGDRGPHAANARSDAAGGGHAHAGLMMYLGGSWPAQYRNRAFMNNIHGQRINQDVIERKQSGYVGKHAPDFLNFNDKWSQVLNLLYDQNGSVYLIDWYDKNQCHHNDVNGHDRSNGRIFKIVYRDEKFTPVDLATKSDDDLVRLQTHENDWYVRHARRLLQERGPNPAVHRALVKLLESQRAEPKKLRALWALHVTGGLTEKLALKLLGAREEYVRAWTIQLLAEDRTVSAGALARFRDLSRNDPSPLVRLYLAAAAQRLPLGSRWEMVERLQAHSDDASDHNLPLMNWFALEPLVAEDPARALDLALNAKLPRLLNFTVRRVALLATPEADRVLVEKILRLQQPARQLEAITGWNTALKGQRQATPPAGWDRIETQWGSSSHPELRAQVLSAAVRFGSKSAEGSLREMVEQRGAAMKARQIAFDALLATRSPELPALLQRLLADPALRSGALRALATFEHPETAAQVLAVFGNLSATEKRDALNTLASRVSFARPLLEAIDRGQIAVRSLTPDLIRQLRSLKHAEIDRGLEKVWGVARESSADKQQEIEKFKRLYFAGGSQPGDGGRGRVVFSRLCQQCHVLFDAGGKVGPDLTGSNRGDLDYILQNMVDPNAVIPNEYRSSTINTRDDRVITGIVKQQDANALTVMTANETLVLPRAEIQSTEQNSISMMPEGLLASLTDQEVRDLIYYLSRPGQVPMPPGAGSGQ